MTLRETHEVCLKLCAESCDSDRSSEPLFAKTVRVLAVKKSYDQITYLCSGMQLSGAAIKSRENKWKLGPVCTHGVAELVQ